MICLIKVIKDIGQSNYRGMLRAADHKKQINGIDITIPLFTVLILNSWTRLRVFLGVILLPDSIRQLLTISK